MKNFKIWVKNVDKKDGTTFTKYGVVRREGQVGVMPLVRFSDSCKKELIKADIELPTKNGHYIFSIDETKLVKTSDGKERKPYFTIPSKVGKDGKPTAPIMWVLGSITCFVKLPTELKEDTTEDYALDETGEENLFDGE